MTIVTQTLSDGSKVYDVELLTQDGKRVILACVDERSAVALQSAILDHVVNVEVQS